MTITFGLIGAGGIASAYVSAFQETAAADLVAVADLDVARATALAPKGATVFSSHQDLLDAGCEAVVLCTPPNTHAPITLDLLSAGIPVLCEKPFSVDSATAQAMVTASRQTGVLLSMASKFRCVDDIITVQKMLQDKVIGDVTLYENCFTGHVDMSTRWNSQPNISGGGVLIDNGTHSVDIMRALLGPLDQILAVEGHRLQGLDVEDTVHVFVRSQSGALGNIDLSWSLHKERDAYVELYGHKGVIRCGWRGSWTKRTGDKAWTEWGTGYGKVAAFKKQIENFAAAVRGDEPVMVSLDDALASVAVVEAGYRALRGGQWESVAEAL